MDAGARQRLTARFGDQVAPWFDELPGVLGALARRWRFELGTPIQARAERVAAATGTDAAGLLGWCTAFAGMTALELASQANGPRPRTEALLGLAARAPRH